MCSCKLTLAFRSMLDTLPKVKHASRRASSSLAATPMTQTWWVGSRSLLGTSRVKHRCCSLQLIAILGVRPLRCRQPLRRTATSFAPLFLPRELVIYFISAIGSSNRVRRHTCPKVTVFSALLLDAGGWRPLRLKSAEYPRSCYLRIAQQQP